MRSVEMIVGNNVLHGLVDEKFEPLLTAFAANFSERDEQGASVCLNVEGETVVDLWGGSLGLRQDGYWEEDSISIVHSVTKGAVALCAHLLIDEGKLALEAKVTDYWPEFGQAGKEDVTVAMMLNHQAGLPALREKLKEGAFHDWDYMVAVLAAEAPFWLPGSRHGYHMSTYGWTVGELVRRVSGLSLGEFFRTHIAEPLDIDFHIGLPDSEHHRVAHMIGWAPKRGDPVPSFTDALRNDRSSVQYLALLNNGKYRTDSPESYRAQYGAGGGVTNARGIAGMYNPLANGGGDVLDEGLIALMLAPSSEGKDFTLVSPTRFSLGFMLSMDNRHRHAGALETMVIGEHAFGHAGAGGSVGFADTECHLGFGYSMNKMGPGILLNERGQSLVDTAYRCLGYIADETGCWRRTV